MQRAMVHVAPGSWALSFAEEACTSSGHTAPTTRSGSQGERSCQAPLPLGTVLSPAAFGLWVPQLLPQEVQAGGP